MSLTEILQTDTKISFPEFILLKASAGTGKTHALTLRFTQFLLSPRIKNNDLRQILAITFTRNAAKEMKWRIIQWLKECYFGQEKTLSQLQHVVELDKETLASRAEEVLENLLSRYSDFQVMTIDSFMTEVFRASAVDLGVSPDFEISLNPLPLIDYAFYRFLRKVTPDSVEGERLVKIASSLQEMSRSEAAFKWDPTEDIKKKFLELYNRLEAMNRRPCLNFHPDKLDPVRQKLQQAAEKIDTIVRETGLIFRKGSSFPPLLEKIKKGFLADILDKNWENMPINQPAKSDPAQIRGYELAQQAWEEFREALNSYKLAHSRLFFRPYLEIYDYLIHLLNEAKRERNIILLDDINCRLASYLNQGIVPDVYFRLGDRIYHYLIDEFQDTSPLQWFNLKPLIENSLAQGGSLFIVGDTKQAIYGFREADYEIMMNLEKKIECFLPVQVKVKELTVNRRSRKKILDFVEKIFPLGIQKLDDFRPLASQSGLDDFKMQVSEEKLREGHPGHVEIEFFRADSEPLKKNENIISGEATDQAEEYSADQLTQVKNKVQSLVAELKERGYDYSDIAILAYKNESVSKIATWLNEKKIPFIPFSALDIRKRKIVQEILALLRFLDFPPDDLSLATFLLGDLLEKELSLAKIPVTRDELQDFILICRQKNDYPLYTAFRDRYGEIWNLYFETLFKTVGYSPLYDLTTQIYRLFNVLDHFPEEEASLVRLLEVIKEFEGRGKNNLREFLLFSREESGEQSLWTIDVAAEIEAVRIMTIHKAKGLGFPVVILVLFPEIDPPPTFYLEENKISEYSSEYYVLKLNKGIIKNQPELQSIYSQYEMKEKVNRLNTLYVALTRARDELYIIGVHGKRSYYPLNLFERLELISDSEYQPTPLKPIPVKERSEKKERSISPVRISFPPRIPSGQKVIFRREEIRRGELIHNLLASIKYLETGWEEKLESLAARLKSFEGKPELIDRAMETVLAFLKNPVFNEYFRPEEGRQIISEMPLVNKDGELFRADRVIIDQNLITIIDFKTGEAGKDGLKTIYHQQIRNYLNILKEIYPQKEIRALIIYLDENSWERVA